MNQLTFCLALALAAASSPAEAFKTSKTYSVRIDGNGAGSWQMRNLVSDEGDACRYTFQWRGTCRIDEFKAGDDISCSSARTRYFNTFIMNAPGRCRGIDEFGQDVEPGRLVGGETTSGRINGVIYSRSSGDVQNLQVRPR